MRHRRAPTRKSSSFHAATGADPLIPGAHDAGVHARDDELFASGTHRQRMVRKRAGLGSMALVALGACLHSSLGAALPTEPTSTGGAFDVRVHALDSMIEPTSGAPAEKPPTPRLGAPPTPPPPRLNADARTAVPPAATRTDALRVQNQELQQRLAQCHQMLHAASADRAHRPCSAHAEEERSSGPEPGGPPPSAAHRLAEGRSAAAATPDGAFAAAASTPQTARRTRSPRLRLPGSMIAGMFAVGSPPAPPAPPALNANHVAPGAGSRQLLQTGAPSHDRRRPFPLSR